MATPTAPVPAPTPYVVASLTTMPARVVAAVRTLGSLVVQTRRPDAIFFNVPETCARLGGAPYTVPADVVAYCKGHGVTLVRCVDSGPATKLVPTLRQPLPPGALIVTVDDDVVYPPGHIAGLLAAHAAHRCAVGYSGFYLLEYNLVQQQAPPAPVDVLEGYAGALYPRDAFDADEFEAYLERAAGVAPDARLADDLLVSNYLASRGVGRTYVAAPGVDRQVLLRAVAAHGRDATALHRDLGNLARYLAIARALLARGQLALRNVAARTALYARLQGSGSSGGSPERRIPERYLSHPNFLCDTMAESAITAAAVMRRRLARAGIGHVYLALTTIPSRFDKLRDVLLALSAQRLDVDGIILSVPHAYARFPDADTSAAAIPEAAMRAVAPDLLLHRCREDYGPGTKLLGALEVVPDDALVLVCDDDTVYSAYAAEELCGRVAAEPGTAWAGCAFALPEYFAEPYWGLDRADGLRKDVAEGFAMVAYRAAWFRRPEWAAYWPAARAVLQKDDDLLLSNYLAGIGVPVRQVATDRYSVRHVHQLQYGFAGDALHQQYAEGTHRVARRGLLRQLAAAGLFRFPGAVP